MKRSILCSLLFTCLFVNAQFTPGNLVVFRIGDGAAPIITTGDGNPAFLDEYNFDGTLVQSIAIPTTQIGDNKSFVTRSGLTEGLLNRSADGRYLIFTGYEGAVGESNSNRLIGRVDFSENIDLTTSFFSSGGTTSAFSDDGTNIWVISSNTVYHTSLGASTATAITDGYGTSVRDIKIFDEQLYVSTANSISAIGNGLPSTYEQPFNNLPGISANFYQFVMFDLDEDVPGNDVIYVAEQSGSIIKYSLVDGSWVNNGSIAAGQYAVGLTGDVNAGSVLLFAVSNAQFGSSGGGQIKTIIDASGYNASFTGTFTTIATAANNTSFRGIAFTPTEFALPVKFESFSASRQPSSVDLRWRTAINDETVLYRVERSADGRNFSGLVELTSREQDHFYSDQMPLDGTAFYRIVATEPNGKITFSRVVRIGITVTNSSVSIFPSPVKGAAFSLQLEKIPEGRYSLQLMNSAGQVVKKSVLMLNGFDSSHCINIEGLLPGMYFLHLSSGDLRFSHRIIKE